MAPAAETTAIDLYAAETKTSLTMVQLIQDYDCYETITSIVAPSDNSFSRSIAQWQTDGVNTAV